MFFAEDDGIGGFEDFLELSGVFIIIHKLCNLVVIKICDQVVVIKWHIVI